MKNPYLVELEPSRGWSEALIIIRGYRSENNFTWGLKSDWKSLLRDAGWKGSIHYLWWDSTDNICTDWGGVKVRAAIAGREHLSRLVAHLSDKSVTLIGYSLGARVIYYGMQNWSSSTKPLNNTILLGGAIRRTKEWGNSTSKLAGQLINVYNARDPTLLSVYRGGEFLVRSSPCGLKPIKGFHPKVTNIDATSLVGTSHCELNYLRTLKQTVGQRLWGG
jgi:hypothetical protein